MNSAAANQFIYSFVSEDTAIELAKHHTNHLMTSVCFGLLFEMFAYYKCPLTTSPMGAGSIVLSLLVTAIFFKCFFDEIISINLSTCNAKQFLLIAAFLFMAIGCGLLTAELLGAKFTPVIKTFPYSFWVLGLLSFALLHIKAQKQKACFFLMQTLGAVFLIIGVLQTNHCLPFLPTSSAALVKLNWFICIFTALAGIASFSIAYIDDRFFKRLTLQRRFTYAAPFNFPRLLADDSNSTADNSNSDVGDSKMNAFEKDQHTATNINDKRIQTNHR